MSQAIAKKKNKKELAWAGAKALLGKPTSEKEAKDQRLVLLTAKILKVTPFGVNVLGGQPYINNLGRKDKMSQYDAQARFEYNWVQRALDDDQKAICEARVVVDNNVGEKQYLTPWIVGECSTVTMGMSTLKGYQNHMAQTRAENRAFQYLYGLQLHREMIENIARLAEETQISDEDKRAIGKATIASAEEVIVERPERQTLSKENKMAELLKVISNTSDKLVLGDKRLKISQSTEYSDTEKSMLIGMIDQKVKLLK